MGVQKSRKAKRFSLYKIHLVTRKNTGLNSRRAVKYATTVRSQTIQKKNLFFSTAV